MFESFISYQFLINAFQIFTIQFSKLLLILIILFIIFEVIPLLLNKENTIKKNFTDLIRYQLLRSVFGIFVGGGLLLLLLLTPIKKGLIDITIFSTFSQVIILYFCIELVVYCAHMLSHKYKIVLLSKSHAFHHEIKDDLQWVNSRKEHLLIIGFFVTVFVIFNFVIFKSSNLSHSIVSAAYLSLNALSHFHIPFSVKFLDQIFLFPKDHLIHHTKRSGPYGVTLSLFDTIFNTRGNNT